MKWTDEAVRNGVIELAKESTDCADLALKLCNKTKEVITPAMLRKAWQRWEQAHDLPPLDAVFGGGLYLDDEDVDEPKLKYPKNTRMPDQPPDHLVGDDGKLPRTLICDGDSHYPIHDPYMENVKLKFAQDIRPDVWVNIGDNYDCWLLSQHDKTETSRLFTGKGRLQEEFNSAKSYWEEVCRVTKRDVHYILGNHEHRLERFISANLWAYQLDAFEWRNLASLPSMVQVHQWGAQKKIGPITFEHGDRIGGRYGAAHPSFWLLQNRGNRNTIFGHFHRVESKTRTVFDEYGDPHTYMAMSQGHGSDTRMQTYAGPEPNWQKSITYIEFWLDNGKQRFTAHSIPIINGKFSFGGKLYDGGRKRS